MPFDPRLVESGPLFVCIGAQIREVPVPRREFVHGDFVGRGELQSRMRGAQEEIAIDGRGDAARVAPTSDGIDDLPPMGEGGRWEELLEGSRCIIEHPGDEIGSAVSRPVIDAATDGEIESMASFDQCPQAVEVTRAPDVVMADICNPTPCRLGDSEIVRRALTASVLLKIVPAHAARLEGRNHLCSFIRAAVTNDNQFKVRVSLP